MLTPEIGNALFLSEIPLGTIISNIEFSPGRGASIARSAGAFAQLMARDGKFATIKLPSGETRLILVTCMAVIGSVSNSDHQLLVSGKAGRSRWLGRRPRTRPVAMNPVDHPMGAVKEELQEDIQDLAKESLQKVIELDQKLRHQISL